MSTKKIEALIQAVDGGCACGCVPVADDVVASAKAELSAIRKAAKTLERLGLAGLKCMTAENIRDHSDAEHLIFTIAKED